MFNAKELNKNLRTGWSYAGVSLSFTLGMWLPIPETAECVLPSRFIPEYFRYLTVPCSRFNAEIDELFERKIKPWRFHKTETATQRFLSAEAHVEAEA